jgi:hypothetical protein
LKAPKTLADRPALFSRPVVLLITLTVMFGSASICRGAFYGRHAGRFLTVEGDLSYRTDLPVDANFEYVMSAPGGWLSQAQKPFPLTKDPVNFWAKFDLPSVGEAKSVLIDSSPWERIEFFFVRDGRLISHQLAGTLVPPGKRSVHVTMTPLFSHSGFSTVELLPNTQVTVFAHIMTNQRYNTIRWLRFYVWDAEEVFAGERRDRQPLMSVLRWAGGQARSQLTSLFRGPGVRRDDTG